jgi:hypothetical protein
MPTGTAKGRGLDTAVIRKDFAERQVLGVQPTDDRPASAGRSCQAGLSPDPAEFIGSSFRARVTEPYRRQLMRPAD